MAITEVTVTIKWSLVRFMTFEIKRVFFDLGKKDSISEKQFPKLITNLSKQMHK